MIAGKICLPWANFLYYLMIRGSGYLEAITADDVDKLEGCGKNFYLCTCYGKSIPIYGAHSTVTSA
jgi:hypothetical protein